MYPGKPKFEILEIKVYMSNSNLADIDTFSNEKSIALEKSIAKMLCKYGANANISTGTTSANAKYFFKRNTINKAHAIADVLLDVSIEAKIKNAPVENRKYFMLLRVILDISTHAAPTRIKTLAYTCGALSSPGKDSLNPEKLIMLIIKKAESIRLNPKMNAQKSFTFSWLTLLK